MRQRNPTVDMTLVLIGVFLSIPCAAQVSLVRDGQAHAVVVLADEPTETARYAARELVWHVERATGVALTILTESNLPVAAHSRIYLGNTETTRRTIDPDRLPREAYVMRSVGNDLFITGKEGTGDPLEQQNPHVGTLFGVYDFLENVLGVRWLWPGELGTYVPKTDTVEIWRANVMKSPALAFRSFYWGRMHGFANGTQTIGEEDARLGFSPEGANRYGQALAVLLRRHQMGGMDAKPPSGHAFSGWWKRYGAVHPEWFALRRDGTRGHPDKEYDNVPMCVSNEALQDFIVDQWDGGDTLLLGPVDRPGRCCCKACRAWDAPQPEDVPWFARLIYEAGRREQDLYGGVTSDRYARFWKAIQQKAAKRNPHVLVSGSFLYENELPAPMGGIRLNKNIYGEFVQWQDPHLRWFPMPDEAFEWTKEQWLGWRKTGIRMAYRPNYLHDGYVMPHFDTEQSGEFFKYAYDHGMEGATFDSLTGQWAAQGLRLYMHLRLMSHPRKTVEAIRNEYFSAFGPAAKTMQRYFDYWESYARDNTMRFIELYWDVGWRYREYVRKAHVAYPPDCFGPAEELLEQALKETRRHASPEFSERVKFIQLGLEHAELATRLTALFDGNEKVANDRLEQATQALKALVKFRKEHEQTFFSDLLHVTSFWERPHMDLAALLEKDGKLGGFPVSTQFSPLPSGKGWTGQEGKLSEQMLRDSVENIIAHGFTGLETNTHRPEEESAFILDYARRRGMILTHHAGGLEMFGRDAPPSPSVYSPEYARRVRHNAEQRLAPLADMDPLYNAFIYQDEPFHWGPKSFGYGAEVKAEFRRRYGYELPGDLDSIRDDPKKWLEVINFRSDNFAVGWRQVYRIVKEINPNFKTVLTHDSHNTFGAGFSSHSELAIDDVFHWGGDFSDMFVFDIYPYMMFDFRFGEPARLPKPRISQTHYAFAQMRNLTRTYGKDLGFWVGTYNPAWFKDFLGPDLRSKYWAEREMSTTAVAQGADFLLTGYKIPIDERHWDSFGAGLRLIQKAGEALLEAPKVKAKACMLFPRTQTIQLQEEYFNVGLAYELFLRAFGELDVLHEEQVTDDLLDGYEILVLFDVKLLPCEVAERIASFVRQGGIVIADCVPRLDAYRQPMSVMEGLFGVKDAETGRIHRFGHWVPRVQSDPNWANRPENPPAESIFKTDRLMGSALGQTVDMEVVSPRPGTVTTGDVLLKTVAGQPGVIGRQVGKGQVFLLCFCLQDSYFKTWQDGNEATRRQLRRLLRALTMKAGVRPHIHGSNPDIEGAIRANAHEGFCLVINHEAGSPDTTIRLADLDFDIGEIIDLADHRPVPIQQEQGVTELKLTVPLGETRLLHVRAR